MSTCLDFISMWIPCVADDEVCLCPYVGVITTGLIQWGKAERVIQFCFGFF